jgi:hypothetical protein
MPKTQGGPTMSAASLPVSAPRTFPSTRAARGD